MSQSAGGESRFTEAARTKVPPWHRAKIVCTLGPATDAPGVLERMIGAGMDVARINMSHGSEAEHAGRIREVRRLGQQLAQPIAVLADLPGPKFRLSEIDGGSRRLEEGSTVTLGFEQASDPALLPVRNPELLPALRAGEMVFLADGAVELRVRKAGRERVRCEVAIGGIVRSGSGINIPESELGPLVPTDEDRRHLAFALDQGVEWVGVSFVQSAADIARVRACCDPQRGPLLMAKIEKRRALAELEAIVQASDGVMVARGDLGVETDLARIPLVQKRIIAAANAQARPVVTATQMLESMIEHEHPTRAEVTDVANAVLDGSDAVMLSGETAIGRHPAAAVAILDRVLHATEGVYPSGVPRQALPSRADAIGMAAVDLAARVEGRAIVAAVDAFDVAAAIAGTRPPVPLVMICASERLARALVMIRGVAPLHAAGRDPHASVALAREWLYAHDLARPGDRVVLLLASNTLSGSPDTLRVVALD